uniref:Transmembrane protein n=1 Tax=Steinernema glaseri TaxID=37863 RepID=A0A1I7ZG05_9BILA
MFHPLPFPQTVASPPPTLLSALAFPMDGCFLPAARHDQHQSASSTSSLQRHFRRRPFTRRNAAPSAVKQLRYVIAYVAAHMFLPKVHSEQGCAEFRSDFRKSGTSDLFSLPTSEFRLPFSSGKSREFSFGSWKLSTSFLVNSAVLLLILVLVLGTLGSHSPD